MTDPKKLPWASRVDVEEISPESVLLVLGLVSARVFKDGRFDLHFQSRMLVGQFMTIDRRLTKEVRDGLEGILDSEWLAWLRLWIEPHPSVSFRRGSVEKEEPRKKPRAPFRVGALGVESTASWNSAHYKGDVFKYAHFVLGDGRQGAVIVWDSSTEEDDEAGLEDLEAYVGDFEEFMRIQSVDEPDDPETWLEYNREFDNGFVWALEKMGSFAEPGLLGTQAREAIREDPSILLPESVERMRPRLSEFPEELREAVENWE